VALGGGVRLGERCFLGGKVGIESGLEIGCGCFLGSGVIVNRSLPNETVIRGRGEAPARYKSSRLKRLRFR
jgi:acetyltransferase-like isoleucine patch superfamily enzyme